MSDREQRVGQQLGNYRLIQVLGRGNFASVYLGQHIYLHTQAAIKVLHEQLLDDSVASFLTEARTIAHLRHPHIIQVLDFGVEDATPFLILDYAPNGNLRQHHQKGMRLALHTVVSYVRQIADALQYAHQRQLIHRDIKPENMLIGRNNEILLSDFGIAILAQNSHSQHSQNAAGTIAYMAPEQFQAHPCPASDQYALGIVVYEWLCGARPFQGSFPEIALKHTLTPPPSLSEQVSTIPSTVEQVVFKALAKDPEQRFASVQDFAVALEIASRAESPGQTLLMYTSGRPADFPLLKTLTIHSNNLPVQSTTFIGRVQEVASVQHLLRQKDTRLLTLTGPGGTGKTRLGVQVAAEVSENFADGLFFVDLASISDPVLVIPTIAQTLGIREVSGKTLLERLKEEVRQKQILLLLDNFEQVVMAAAQVADLLAACPNLKVMVTSREVLHIQAEREFEVPPLALPDLKRLSDLAGLSQSSAVKLFIQRAQAIKPDFQLTKANAPAIANICARLDGLPLAIELAAVRIKLLPPQALLARLGQRLAILTSASKDVPMRQQTLRNTIAWSYHLLPAEEQQLFRQFSVFVGGCTLEAVEATCAVFADGRRQVLDEMASLLDKSLLQQIEYEGDEPRLTMLETIREYGLECLRESGEAEASQRAHALYYLAFAEEVELHLKGEQQIAAWRRLEREQENLRAALAWLIGQGEGELALRLSGALWWFWYTRGYWSEGWHWVEAVLGLAEAQRRTVSRAKVLYGAGDIAYRLGYAKARSLLEESVAIYRQLEDRRGLAESLGLLGLGLSEQNEAAAARTLLEESLMLARELRDPWLLARALVNIGSFMDAQGDFKQARLCLEESLTLYRTLKDQQALSLTRRRLIHVALFEGQVTQAAALAQENLAVARELENGPDMTRALYWLAVTQIMQSEIEQAAALLEESLVLAREQDDTPEIGNIQLTLGDLTIYRGDLLQAETRVQESLTLFRELRDREGIALALSALGDIRRRQGDLTQARVLCTEGMLLAREAGMRYSLGWNLIGLARITADEGQPEQAARLFGAAASWFNPAVEMDPFQRADYEWDVESVRALLGKTVFGAAWAEGQSMTPEQALNAQASLTGPPPGPAARPSTSLSSRRALQQHFGGLTPREREVARLVAQGKANRAIADELVVGVSTVEAHVSHIFTKLGFSSRAQIAAWAVDKGLIQVSQDVERHL